MRIRRSHAPQTRGFPAPSPRRPARWHCVAVCVFLVASSACGNQDLASELDRVRSWTSTTDLASERRAAGAIDRAVALQIAHRAAQARARSRQSLDKLAVTDSQRTAANALLDSLRDGIVRLRLVTR